MKLAGADAERFCRTPKSNIWAALIFGDDEGVVDDSAAALSRAWSEGAGGAEIIVLDEDNARREKALLFESLEARSLLGAKRVVKLSVSGDKISTLISETISAAEEDPERFEAKLIISAPSLPKRSKTRATFETAKQAAALHLFADDIASLSALAAKALEDQGAAIDSDALDALLSGLPGHRGLANAEIEKLALYAHGLERSISVDDVQKLRAADTDVPTQDLLAAALKGRTSQAEHALSALLVRGVSPITILRAIQRDAERLLDAHGLQDAKSGGDIGMKLRPPVFRSAWPAFRDLMAIWTPAKLSRLIERLYDCERDLKTAGRHGDALVRTLIIDMCRSVRRV